MKFKLKDNKIVKKRGNKYYGDYRLSKLERDFVLWFKPNFTDTEALVVQFAEDGKE